MSKNPVSQARLAFARNMKWKRLDLNFSQERLAELTGLHRTYISSVERGERNVSVDNMGLIAEAMNVPIAELLKDV